MKILFIAKHKLPHIGGVERHIKEIAYRVQGLGYSLTTISEEDIKHPKVKILGLLYIWYWLFNNRKLIINADIVHIHDVFIWYLPFRFIFPKKKVFITFHGWEGKYPPTAWSILNKKLANYLCSGSIVVGKYINKYYAIKSDFVVYGGAEAHGMAVRNRKTKNSIVWLGRQDADTGINEFKKWLSTQTKKYNVTYVTNDPNPEKYLKTAEYCVPSGYLSYLEAKNYRCKILTFANNPLKEDYWKEISEAWPSKPAQNLKKIPSWEDVTDVYIKLWKKIN